MQPLNQLTSYVRELPASWLAPARTSYAACCVGRNSLHTGRDQGTESRPAFKFHPPTFLVTALHKVCRGLRSELCCTWKGSWGLSGSHTQRHLQEQT